jgi:uncharacterized protein YdiU (UPF0061 family)
MWSLVFQGGITSISAARLTTLVSRAKRGISGLFKYVITGITAGDVIAAASYGLLSTLEMSDEEEELVVKEMTSTELGAVVTESILFLGLSQASRDLINLGGPKFLKTVNANFFDTLFRRVGLAVTKKKDSFFINSRGKVLAFDSRSYKDALDFLSKIAGRKITMPAAAAFSALTLIHLADSFRDKSTSSSSGKPISFSFWDIHDHRIGEGLQSCRPLSSGLIWYDSEIYTIRALLKKLNEEINTFDARSDDASFLPDYLMSVNRLPYLETALINSYQRGVRAFRDALYEMELVRRYSQPSTIQVENALTQASDNAEQLTKTKSWDTVLECAKQIDDLQKVIKGQNAQSSTFDFRSGECEQFNFTPEDQAAPELKKFEAEIKAKLSVDNTSDSAPTYVKMEANALWVK